jgi:hypothetical protein
MVLSVNCVYASIGTIRILCQEITEAQKFLKYTSKFKVGFFFSPGSMWLECVGHRALHHVENGGILYGRLYL